MKTQVTVVTPKIGTSLLVSANASRYYLGVGVFNSSGFSVSIGPYSTLIQNGGFPFTNSWPKHEFFFNSHGVVVQEDWYAYSQNGTTPFTVVEGLWLIGS